MERLSAIPVRSARNQASARRPDTPGDAHGAGSGRAFLGGRGCVGREMPQQFLNCCLARPEAAGRHRPAKQDILIADMLFAMKGKRGLWLMLHLVDISSK